MSKLNIFYTLYSFQNPSGQQSSVDATGYCSTSSSIGYLPAWQHQYQLPGQELAFHGNRYQTQAQIEPMRSSSAPPVTITQESSQSSQPIVSSVVMQSDAMNIDSPSSLFAI